MQLVDGSTRTSMASAAGCCACQRNAEQRVAIHMVSTGRCIEDAYTFHCVRHAHAELFMNAMMAWQTMA